jgi:hypothetical protein
MAIRKVRSVMLQTAVEALAKLRGIKGATSPQAGKLAEAIRLTVPVRVSEAPRRKKQL